MTVGRLPQLKISTASTSVGGLAPNHKGVVPMLKALTLVAFAAALVAPAFAIDGRTAVEACINSTAQGDHCAWAVNDKGEVDLCNKSGCVYCASATAECTAAAKGRPRPNRSLPLGARVKTPVGAIEVTPSIVKGSILRALCPDGLRPCPGHGCIAKDDKCDPVQ